jgi:hypothetical protein
MSIGFFLLYFQAFNPVCANHVSRFDRIGDETKILENRKMGYSDNISSMPIIIYESNRNKWSLLRQVPEAPYSITRPPASCSAFLP